MESIQKNEYFLGEDMPHLEYMDEHDLTADQFSESLRQRMDLFDDSFEKAMTDGIVDVQEYYSLHAFSSELKILMLKELKRSKSNGETGALITVFAALGAVIGLNKIFGR